MVFHMWRFDEVILKISEQFYIFILYILKSFEFLILFDIHCLVKNKPLFPDVTHIESLVFL